MNNELITCHFTLQELEYINAAICREVALSKYVDKQLEGLELVGVKMNYLEQPNIFGKLLSYIKKGSK